MERPLLYYATSITENQDAALDVLQDVWLKVVQGVRSLEDPGALRQWLYTITHSIAVDTIRRDYRRDKAEQAHLDEAVNVEEPSFDDEDVFHNQVATLKEIKQVQHQLLEVQASLRNTE